MGTRLGTSDFRVGLSNDLRSADGSISWGDIGLSGLDEAGVSWDFLAPDDGALTAAHVDGWDAVLFAAPAAKDRLVRQSDWADRLALMGRGLTGRRVGTFGLGNIAFELFDLLAPFATQNFATDPHRSRHEAAARGVSLVELDELLSICDIVVITASLTGDTRHAINARRLALMRPEAILINVARGPILDTDALTDAIAAGRLAGAGLDVFDPEPLPAGHPLLALDNVVLSPHALAWTDEMGLGNGTSAVRAILDLRDGRRPKYLAG